MKTELIKKLPAIKLSTEDGKISIKVDRVRRTYTSSEPREAYRMSFKCPACSMSTGTEMQSCPCRDMISPCARFEVISMAEEFLEERFDQQFMNVDGAGI